MLSQERRVGLAVFALAVGMAAAVACGGGSSGGYGTNPSPMPTPTPTTTPADVTITINGMSADKSFSPNPAAAKAGQKVAWHNSDSIAHTATGAGFDTGIIAAGATSAPITFASAGSFDYHCSVHPSMVGTLSVTP